MLHPARETTVEQVRAGKLRALAVTTPIRSPALPNIPTIGEFVAGYEASVWNGVVAPKGTPAVIVNKPSVRRIAGMTTTARWSRDDACCMSAFGQTGHGATPFVC